MYARSVRGGRRHREFPVIRKGCRLCVNVAFLLAQAQRFSELLRREKNGINRTTDL